eukprot:g9252.t1
MSTDTNAEMLVDQSKPLIIVTLNRPKALNALNTSMINQLTTSMKEWDSEDHKARCVVIRGNGGKAFCAGGDVKTVTLSPVEDRIDFFRREYQMNYQISKLKKPVVCLMDGIVMGGGCGVAMHTPFRIATEKSVCAMPEGLIGFTPDVGSSYFLNRLPDSIGNYLAMTGKNLKGLELKAVGLATHYIASKDMPLVISKLEEMGEEVRDHSRIDSTLKKLEVDGHLDDMDSTFTEISNTGKIFNPYSHSLDEIFEKLEASSEGRIKEALDGIKSCAPLSVALAYELLKRMAGSSLRVCLETEMTLAAAMSRDKGEFIEGVRALLVDKDKNPKWKYTREQITSDLIDSFFEGEEQDLPLFSPAAKL